MNYTHHPVFHRSWLKRLNATDLAVLAYLLFTLLLNVFWFNKLGAVWSHILLRLFVITGIMAIIELSERKPHPFLLMIRSFYPLATLAWLYGETDFFNNIFLEYQDGWFVNADEWLFSFQPSLRFSEVFHQVWFSELMHLSYFSYFFAIIGVSFGVWKWSNPHFSKVIFCIMQTFFLYYLVFIFFPVKGPQFWFPGAVDQLPEAGIFRKLVMLVQIIGEAPTGAFPSSHIAMSVILTWFSYKYLRKIFVVMVFISLLICLATVYIKAHYAVDVIAGILTAPLFLWFSERLYQMLVKQ